MKKFKVFVHSFGFLRKIFAHRLRQHDLNSEDFCKTYEYELLCFMLEEDPECIQHTLQYVSKMNYLIIARTLAEKGYELNIGKMREEFLLLLCK